MKINITGTFHVNLTPQETSFKHNTALQAGRLNIDKTFEGILDGSSHGEMLSIMDQGRKSGGYVAIEIFEGRLEGKQGSFALQHYGRMEPSGQTLTLEIVPGSGEGELTGISGSMQIRIEEKQHYYELKADL